MIDSRAELNAHLMELARCYAARAVEALGDEIVSIAIYGSVSRGEARSDSDIDLYIVLREAPSGMLNRRRILDPVRELLAPELEKLWKESAYIDFVEVIRTRSEAEKFHPLYLDMSQEAVLLYDRDGFLERILAEINDELLRSGAERKSIGKVRFWDLSGRSRPPTPDEVAEP